jgi:hypothetical protein
MLNELERLHSVEHQNAYRIGQDEESVDLNMDLFEELQDIEFTPPLLSSSEDNGPVKFVVPSLPVSSPLPVASPSIVVIPSNDSSKFSAEFKSILESLNSANRINVNSGNGNTIAISNFNKNEVSSFGSLFQTAGIPTTTVVGDECLIPVEFVGRPCANGSIGEDEAESMDLDGIIISDDDITLVNESELFSLGELSAELATDENSNSSIVNGKATLVNGVLPYWAKDMTIPLDDLDTEMIRNVDTLDALLKGDVSAAKNVIHQTGYSSPVPVEQAYSPIPTYSSSDDDDDDALVEEAVQPAEVLEAAPTKKPERRGRKPAKYNKNSLNYIKDKSLRKKEQNKTAATRYRQKKKEELAVTLAEEDELQEVHDELEKQKGKLGSEISVIRSLLRDMLHARKQRVSPASSSVTASSLVQAQRIAKNRK